MVWPPNRDTHKKVLKMERKRRRSNSRRIGDILLLEFTRQVVDMIFKKHSDFNILPQQKNSTMLQSITLAELRFDSGSYLVRLTTKKGVCKCNGRFTYHCILCNFALHLLHCYFKFHIPPGLVGG